MVWRHLSHVYWREASVQVQMQKYPVLGFFTFVFVSVLKEKWCITAQMLRPRFCSLEESRGHLKKQRDSAVVDGACYFAL